MKARHYFFAMFALVLLTIGLVGVLREPQLTNNIVQWVLGLLLFIGFLFLLIGFFFTQGPQER